MDYHTYFSCLINGMICSPRACVRSIGKSITDHKCDSVTDKQGDANKELRD